VLTWKPGWFRGYFVRSDGRTTQPPKDRRELRGYEAFLEQAHWAAEWQWRRGESFERKAGAVLAFVGILVTLQTGIMDSIITVPRTALTWAMFVLLTLSAGGLAWATVESVLVLMSRKYRGPRLEQLQREWETYNTRGHLSPQGVVGLFADQLLRDSGGSAPILSLYEDADKRGKHFSRAIRALGASIVLMVLVLVIAALQAAAE
jgi:hypothetical protein